MSGIKVRSLTKRWGDLLAVDHISFEIQRGEVFGFLGPNGAGKTTTIRMITGIIRPDSGSIAIMGYDIQKDLLKAKQLIGVVPETNNLYLDLSALENIMLIAQLYKISKIRAKQRAEKILREFGLIERKDQRVNRFSQGMKRRLVLATALVGDPEVLFLDEPTRGLDVKSSRFLRKRIREFPARGGTVFLATHNMEEANWLCDRIAIIDKGKIIAMDTPEGIKQRIRGLQAVEVAFDQDVNPEVFKSIKGVTMIKKVSGKVIFYCDHLGITVTELVKCTCSKGLKVIDLATIRPTLEEAFLQLVEGERNNE